MPFVGQRSRMTLRLPYPGRARQEAYDVRLAGIEDTTNRLQAELAEHKDHTTAELAALGGDMDGTAAAAVKAGLDAYSPKIEAMLRSALETFAASQWESVLATRMHELLTRLVKWVRRLFWIAAAGVGAALWHQVGERLVDTGLHLLGAR